MSLSGHVEGPRPTEDTVFRLDGGADLRQRGTDASLPVQQVQLKSRIEHFNAFRQVAAGSGRYPSREPIQNKLIKQKAAIPPPVEATGGSSDEGSSLLDGDALP